MPVKLIPLSCPKCGGQLQIPADVDKCFCTFCGTQILIDDGTITVHVHNYDEAELRRIEIEQEERAREERERVLAEEQASLQEAAWMKRRKRWRIALLAYFAIVVFGAVVISPVEDVLPGVYNVLLGLWGVFFLLGPIALFIQRPNKGRKRRGPKNT